MKETDDDKCGALITDLVVHGIWQPPFEAIFDIRVVDTDELSYYDCSSGRLTNIRDGQKVQVFSGLSKSQSKFYSSLHFSGWIAWKETDFFLYLLREFLCVKWE